jgi:zinc protease
LSDEPLVPNLPKKGKIESINENAIFGTKELLLSNGVRVSLKKTDFKEDQILFSAVAEGGLSMIDVEDLPSARMMNAVLPLGGWGNFSPTDLSKKLAGDRASVTFTANRYNQIFNGNSTVKDVETLLQLLYLQFTAPRQDTAAYQDYLKRRENTIRNRLKNPMNGFNDVISNVRYGDNPYTNIITADDLKKADYDRIIQIYEEKFVANASAYHFSFVGNLDEEILLPFIEQYIASLPSTKEKSTWRDVGVKTRAGEHRVEYAKKLEIPKATVYSLWSGDMEYNLRNQILHSAMMDIMRFVYIEKIREEQGGTYGVTIGGGWSKIPREQFTFTFRFDTDAPLVEPLLTIANTELDHLQTEGPSEENWQKVKESMLKKRTEDLNVNDFWLNTIQQYYSVPIDRITDYVDIVNSITTNEIRDYARSFFSQKNNIKVIQLPE